MTVSTPTSNSTVAAPPAPVASQSAGRATYADAVRSEWTKFRSVRASYWSLFAAAALGIGLGALISWLGADRYNTDPTIHFGWNPVTHSLRSLTIAQLAMAVLGVITVSAEYSTGMIRTSLTAVPKRVRIMSAKLLVLTAVAVVIGQGIGFAAFSLGQALIHGKAPSASLGQHLVLRVVIGAGLYLALLALLAGAVAVLLRHAAAGIAVMVALLFVLPGIALALPTSWSQPIEEWWPTNAGQQVYALHRDSHTLTAWLGFGWMAAFAAAVIIVAFFLLERRDA